MSNLLIVESPAKAKTIKKYLGNNYKVLASVGHIRDLPKSKLGIDVEHGFVPQYISIRGKADVIKELKKEAKNASKVLLATDPDREGEAISWHLSEVLDLPKDKPIRVTFNEITEHAVQEGVKKARVIDMNLVDAQQARRVLDRLVGYEISPILWKKIRRGLSAGRVQSVATKLIVDRENEIKAFVPQEYWSICVELTRQGEQPSFAARFFGDENGKMEIGDGETAQRIATDLKASSYSVKELKTGKKNRTPPPPFITSSLQQESSKFLNMSPKRCMQIAQELYEGVEIPGVGLTGLITYMRTDSLRLSEDALNEAREFIQGKYGKEYCPANPRRFKTKSQAQDAHEAIRATSVKLTPELLKKSLSHDQYRLYKLIWERFVASQMEAQVLDTISADIAADAGEKKYILRASGFKVFFAGYTVLYDDSKSMGEDEENTKLPSMKTGDALSKEKVLPEQHFTQPPSRYSEATLIKTFEENGIGRPSTYAPTISTILQREYVVKDGKFFKPTELGYVTTKFMEEQFGNIVDVEFTANMEEKLDHIEEGEQDWAEMVGGFYTEFQKSLKETEAALDGVHIKVPDEETEELCDLCGRKMVIKSGRFGKFLACPGYPECKNTKPISYDTGALCPKCGGRILQKFSKNKNKYYACSNGPKCDFITWYEPVSRKCDECGNVLLKKTGFKGRFTLVCSNKDCKNADGVNKK